MRVKELIELLGKAPKDDIALVQLTLLDRNVSIDDILVGNGTIRGRTYISLDKNDEYETLYCENKSELYDDFECSECGLIMTENERCEIDDEGLKEMYAFAFDYCPRCGRKVK